MNWKIETASNEDFDWIKPLFESNKKILGSYETVIWQWRSVPVNKRSPFIVIRPWAFAHFLVKKKINEKSLYEIAVDPSMKRKGLGSALMNYIGYPMILKTDADNEESNAFYKAKGFILMGNKHTKSGKLVNIYQKFE